jgi:hypothetical protein
MQEASVNPRLDFYDSFKRYLKESIEPKVIGLLEDMLLRTCQDYHRVSLDFIWTSDWKVELEGRVAMRPNRITDAGDILFVGGRGYWMLYINDECVDFVVGSCWDHDEGYLSVTVDEENLEKIIKGEPAVPGFIGLPSMVEPGEPQHASMTMLDAIDVGHKFQMISDGQDLPIRIPKKRRTKPVVQIDESEADARLDDLLRELRKAILSLGWKPSDIDKERYHRCAREALEQDGKLETAITLYLRK